VVRPASVGVQQPQFPGSIPSAPTQQVVMVPNHLLSQVQPFSFYQPGTTQQVPTIGGVGFPGQPMFMPQMMTMQNMQQQQAARQQATNQAAQNQQRGPAQGVPAKPPGQTNSSPQSAPNPLQANQPSQPAQANPQQPNQSSNTPIHPMNAPQQPQQFMAFVQPQHMSYGHPQFAYMQQSHMMMNPIMQAQLQQQQQLARHLQQQQQLQQQQAQQQSNMRVPGAKDQNPTQGQPQAQPMNYANTAAFLQQQPQQIRLPGGPMPPIVNQNQMSNQNQWLQGKQQFQARQPPPQQATPQIPPQAPNVVRPAQALQPGPSKPPSTKPNLAHKEMLEKFKIAAGKDGGVSDADIRAERSTSPPFNNSGTPLSAKAKEFVPGGFSPAESASAPPKQEPKKVAAQPLPSAEHPPTHKKDPTLQPVKPPQTQKAKTPDVDEQNVIRIFDPVLDNTAKSAEENPAATRPAEAETMPEDVSSPRSQPSVDVDEVDESITNDDDDTDSTIDTKPNVEEGIYSMAFLIKMASSPECKEIHPQLNQQRYSSIKDLDSHRTVQQILDTSSHRKYSNRHQKNAGYNLSRDFFGTKKVKGKKTPKGKRGGKYPQHPPLGPYAPLQTGDDSWFVMHRQKNSPLDLLKKKSLALLNKLTLENREKICDQFTQHIVNEVKSPNECNVVVSTIFEKSCAEAKFSNLYADLCFVVQDNLAGVPCRTDDADVDPQSQEDLKSLFRRSIINLCQHNFNQRLSNEALEGTNEQIMSKLDKSKRMMMGNIKFIGDLFKHKLIHESIVHHIIAKLLTPRDEDYDSNEISRRKLDDQLEGCCRLMQTVGKQIDVPKAKEWIDQYFDYMHHFQKNAQNRIHFMVLEIVELREKKWVPRRETETVKLKKDVRKEFEQEQMRKEMIPKRGKRGHVKVGAKKTTDFRDRRGQPARISNTRRDNNAWGVPSRSSMNAPSMKKNHSQDIRSSSAKTMLRSSTPVTSSQPPTRRTNSPLQKQTATAPESKDALQAEWDEFAKGSKYINDAELNKFLERGNSESQRIRWGIFCEHFIGSAQRETQKQMLTTLQYFNRANKKKRLDVNDIKAVLGKMSPRIEAIGDDFDAPKAAEYYGYLVAELAVTNRISAKQVVCVYNPSDLERETSQNKYMTGFLMQLAQIDEPDGKAYAAKHAEIFVKAFLQNPKDYGKPVKPDRRCIPSPDKVPLAGVVFGESSI